MSVVRWFKKAAFIGGKLSERWIPRTVRCDDCGIISSDESGYYNNPATGRIGHINSKGRNCEHDFCCQCSEKDEFPYDCPKCGCPEATQENEQRYLSWRAKQNDRAK